LVGVDEKDVAIVAVAVLRREEEEAAGEKCEAR
jgi:hypothetical protein